MLDSRKFYYGNTLKKILLLSFLLSITLMPLSAKGLYIKVMSVSHTDSLFSVQYDLNRLGYKMFLTEYKEWNRVYTGPFKNINEANRALVKVKKYVSKGAYITDLTITNNKITSMQTQQVKVPSVNRELRKEEIKAQPINKSRLNTIATISIEVSVQQVEKSNSNTVSLNSEDIYISTESKKDNSFFIGLTAGFSKIRVNQNNISGNLPLNFVLQNYGINYGVEAGYYINNNIFMTLNYQKTDLKNVSFDNAFGTLDYKFDKICSISPYIGLLGGYGMMTWQNSPIDSVTTTDSSSNFIGGLQVGSDIPISNEISMYIFYRYIMLDYVTNLKTDTAEKKVEYSRDHNFNIGIKYNF